jgi:hypothetical protein
MKLAIEKPSLRNHVLNEVGRFSVDCAYAMADAAPASTLLHVLAIVERWLFV